MKVSTNYPRTSRQRDRTFTGCWKCRSRKIKCDEKTPECTPCRRLRQPCGGYESKLVWVENDNKTYISDGRRYVRTDLTWGDLPVLESELVDFLISQSDDSETDNAGTAQGFWRHFSHNPFNVFRTDILPCDNSPLLSVAKTLPGQTLTAAPEINEHFLFHHYVTHVAFIMMPFEHPRNPWKSDYPAVALNYVSTEQKALYNAILAHAAFNLAHLGTDRERMLAIATKHYNFAIDQLMAGFENGHKDYGGFIAAIMTLMMAEIYSGESKKWKFHFHGAWAFLREQQSIEPWTMSDFAWASTQSLYIIKIIGETSEIPDTGLADLSPRFEDSGEDMFVSSISSRSNFGFTIGASRTLLECISSIKNLANQIQHDRCARSTDEAVIRIVTRLESCRGELSEITASAEDISDSSTDDSCLASKPHNAVQHQLNAFIAATYIYLYRVVFDLPPCNVTSYVSDVFESVSAFLENGGGNLSLWPAFIAAVEAYEDKHMNAAVAWLNSATKLGMGNRLRIKRVVEEVWRRRKVASEELDTDIGSIAVDWREVMKDLNVDILLV